MTLLRARKSLAIAATVLLFAAGHGCGKPGSNSKEPVVVGTVTPASPADLDALIQQRGSVTFRSFGGKWIGKDGDTDICFREGGKAVMLEYGYAMNIHPGTADIDSSGNITLRLPDFGQSWPSMKLMKDSKSLFLVPEDGAPAFITGNRGGTTFTSADGRYWPFRPIAAEDEAYVLKRIATSSPSNRPAP